MADDLVHTSTLHSCARGLEAAADIILAGQAPSVDAIKNVARHCDKAAARIEELEAALAEARRTALTECLRIAKAAQYSKAPATDTMRGIQKLIEDSPTPPPVV